MKLRSIMGILLISHSLLISISYAKTATVTWSDNAAVAPVRDCRIPLRKLLASSNQSMIAAEHPKATDLDVLMEKHDDRKEMWFIQIINVRQAHADSAPGAGHYGWVVYNEKTGELWDERDQEHPQKLTTDPAALENYRMCKMQDDRCFQANQNMTDDPTGGFYPNAFEVEGDSSVRYIASQEKRQHLYWAPNKECTVNAFVVNNDKILALSWGQQPGFIWSRYVHPVTKKIIEGWLPGEVVKTKEQICNTANQQATGENAAPINFVTRTVSNQHQRLYFYDAPNEICQNSTNAFLIDGDKVPASDKPPQAGFTFVRYTHPSTQNVTSGWVHTRGLVQP